MRGRFRLWYAALLAVPAAAATLVMAQGRRTRDDPRAVLASLRTAAGPALPAAAAASASSSTEPARYDRESLYELVDGAAEGYLARGFERCVAATYAFQGTARFEVAAEVYRFASDAGARAQLDADRPRSTAPLDGALAAVSDGNVLLATRGRDLLKLTALTTDPGGREALGALADAWLKESP
jgi:hypothetical protein